jgi:two-component system, LytTR family, sensor histidine kinase AgrC
MYTGFFDVINTIIQSIMFVIAANYCVDKSYKKSKIPILILITLISLAVVLITFVMGNSSLSMIIIHLAILFLVTIPYNYDKLGAITGFSIIYFAIGINAIICLVVFILVINNTSIDITYANLAIMYLPQFIASYFLLKNMSFVYKLSLSVKSRVSSILTLIIITLSLDFIMSFLIIYNDKDNPIFKEIIFVLLGIFVIFITFYFAKVNERSNEIHNLNKELEKKINELKKIKHDHGSQISYLYGAHLMGNYEKLGELLKGIIAGNNISTNVKVLSSEYSIISQIVNSIDLKDVDVLIDEKAELEHTNVSEIELQRVISNIVKNSVEALDGKGLLMIKSYYSYNNIVISVQNNGPEIDKNIINRIFQQGFSTKENKNGDNGFGLYIVKEIVDKYNGDIDIVSSKELTEFIIKLPLHIN